MWHQWEAGASILSALVEVDRRTAEQVRGQRCRCCRGPLHAGHYERKPRGLPAGLEARWLPEFSVRWSLCCGHCRRRTTPPSVRFLGRKVYVGFVVFRAVLRGLLERGAKGADDGIGRVPRRTVRRWAGWWSRGFGDIGAKRVKLDHGSTTGEQIDLLIAALEALGLVSDERPPP